MQISADIVFGMADIPDIFVWYDWYTVYFVCVFGGGGGGGGCGGGGRINTRCWGPAYVADKIQSTPPPHLPGVGRSGSGIKVYNQSLLRL